MLAISRWVVKPRSSAVWLLVCAVLFGTSVLPVQADNSVSETTTQTELASLQQQMQQTLSSFVGRLSGGSKGEILKGPAEAIVQQWLANAALARRLTGGENWRELSAEQKQLLADELNRTLTRYLLEASEQYSGQQLSLDKIEVTAANRRNAQLTLRGISGIESIPIAIELISHQGAWRVADFSVEGVSYSGMKRWQHEVLWRTGGFSALFDHIKAKNDQFFAELIPVPTAATASDTATTTTGKNSATLASKP